MEGCVAFTVMETTCVEPTKQPPFAPLNDKAVELARARGGSVDVCEEPRTTFVPERVIKKLKTND